jgi:hypothetical protein
VAAPQGTPDSGAASEDHDSPTDRAGTPEQPLYEYCEQHGHVIAPHVCNGNGAAPAAPGEPTVIDIQPEPRAKVSVVALYEKSGKLTKSQAEKFCEQHEREMIEDMGAEPEWLHAYIRWVFEAVQGIGPKHTAADAFASGFTAGKS